MQWYEARLGKAVFLMRLQMRTRRIVPAAKLVAF